MPDNTLYILTSEALDVDSLASALLFAELWQALPDNSRLSKNATLHPGDSNNAKRQQKATQLLDELISIKREYANSQLCLLLPISSERKAELLWRIDIAYLLGFLSPLDRPLDYLEQLFAHAHCRIQFGNPYFRTLNQEDGLILLDRHHLPEFWYSGETNRIKLDSQVLAIFDHRPDSGSLTTTPIRHIQSATSCVSLLLEISLGKTPISPNAGFPISEAAALLCLAALHLDQQQHDSLQSWEQPLWQKLVARFPSPVLGKYQIEGILRTVLQKRENPDLNLFEQINNDVKITTFINENFSIAVATVAIALQTLKQLSKTGELVPFVQRCLEHQQADFLILLHRQSQKNPRRALSFCFISNKIEIPNLWQWNVTKIDFFLETLKHSFPFRVIYPQPYLFPPKEAILLVQAEQENQKLSRKAFMPALRQSFQTLLQRSKGL